MAPMPHMPHGCIPMSPAMGPMPEGGPDHKPMGDMPMGGHSGDMRRPKP